MNCSDISCGFNSFISNGECKCPENSFGNPEVNCTYLMEFFWYGINVLILTGGAFFCCISNIKRKKTYNKNEFIINENNS